ncbi:MAG: hemerythrin family protein [Rhodocyclaceae bacterium]|nr:hemerythrin family protein [Rhodocyclaceae bacterium]
MEHSRRADGDADPATGAPCLAEAVHSEHAIQRQLLRALAAVVAEARDTSEFLQALADFSQRHFEREERAMARHRYPDGPAHCAEHRRLQDEIECLQALAASDKPVGDALVRFAAALQSHVEGADASLLAHVAGHAGRTASGGGPSA